MAPQLLGCGDLSKLRLNPGGPFARGLTKSATRAWWGTLEVTVLQPYSEEPNVCGRFDRAAKTEQRWLLSVAHEARYSQLRTNMPRYYGSCASKRGEQFMAMEGRLVRPTTTWPFTHKLDLALQLASLGLRLQRAGLVSCDWKLDQIAVNFSGALRLVDVKNIEHISSVRLACSTNADCCHCDHCGHKSSAELAEEQLCDLRLGRCRGSTFTTAAMVWATADNFFRPMLDHVPRSTPAGQATEVRSLLEGMQQRSPAARWNWTQVVATLHRLRASDRAHSSNRSAGPSILRDIIEADYYSAVPQHHGLRQ